MRPLHAQINLNAFKHNLNLLAEKAPNASMIAVVKANAYGHGIECLLPALTDVPRLAVACIEEAIALRRLGAQQPIVLLEGVFEANELPLCAQLGFEPLLHNQQQLDWLKQGDFKEVCSTALRAWLKCDTGMRRLGFAPEDFPALISDVQPISQVHWQGVMTHFACADEADLSHALAQLRVFDRLNLPHQWQRCCANSAGLLRIDGAQFDWVRTGLALYGISPIPATVAADYGLRPVMRLSTRVLAVHQLNAGDSAGYGQSFVAHNSGRLATIALGYGDGFPRAILSGEVNVLINGGHYPLVGRIMMDMALVWIGDDTVAVGDEVLVWGDEQPVEQVAAAANTIPYTLTTMLTGRVHREVIE